MPSGTNPIIVQSDRSVLLEVHNPLYEEARDTLAGGSGVLVLLCGAGKTFLKNRVYTLRRVFWMERVLESARDGLIHKT